MDSACAGPTAAKAVKASANRPAVNLENEDLEGKANQKDLEDLGDLGDSEALKNREGPSDTVGRSADGRDVFIEWGVGCMGLSSVGNRG